MTELNAPGTYDGKPVSALSDARVALARTDVANGIARIEAAPPRVQADKAEYLDRMRALRVVIEAEIAGRERE